MKRIMYILMLLSIVSCATKEADPIKLNSDGCDFCKMKIANGKFGAEIITTKGRVYKFDDMHCMVNYQKENNKTQIQSFYIHDYNQDNVLIPAGTAYYATGGEINSPMRGNIIAVQTEKEAIEIAKQFQAEIITWSEIIK